MFDKVNWVVGWVAGVAAIFSGAVQENIHLLGAGIFVVLFTVLATHGAWEDR